ncbi:hypothetical protein CIB48_g7374 [Xylaria polymorpha]|nr:hypothetical protein CIB48_g7374 [Xylaria polymorpha]
MIRPPHIGRYRCLRQTRYTVAPPAQPSSLTVTLRPLRVVMWSLPTYLDYEIPVAAEEVVSRVHGIAKCSRNMIALDIRTYLDVFYKQVRVQHHRSQDPSPVSSLPPPPKAGERYQLPTQTAAPPAATIRYPHQMAIPAPTVPQPSQQRGTSTTAMASSSPYNAQMPFTTTGIDAQSFSHPTGYQQNANASELDQHQRSAMQQRDLDDSGNSIWGAAKKLAQQTGERLAAAESEVWKKINKD